MNVTRAEATDLSVAGLDASIAPVTVVVLILTPKFPSKTLDIFHLH
jgi:hypothetical protein